MEGSSVEGGSSSAKSGPGIGLSALPEGCIADILALTSPQDVGRMAAVSTAFLSASESDAVWEKFLPVDYQEIMRRSSESSSRPHFSSKKELYLSLCDFPMLIDGGKKSFWLEKKSGNKCYTLSARELTIIWGDTPHYWTWDSVPESRFSEVAYLRAVCWFEIRGKINTCMLSSKTNYAAYLVLNPEDSYGFDDIPVESSIEIGGVKATTKTIYLTRYKPEEDQVRNQYMSVEDVKSWIDESLTQLYSSRESSNERLGLEDVKTWMINNLDQSHSSQEEQIIEICTENDFSYPKQRKDKWYEIELGEFFNGGGEDMEVEISVLEVKDGQWKSDVIIEGIEIRPKK